MKKLITLLLMVCLLFGIISSCFARTPEQLNADVQYLYDQIDILEASSQYSNDDISSLWVDFTNISTIGNVSMSVYESVYANPTLTTNFNTVKPYSWDYAEQELIKYGLGNIANYYRAEPYNTDITCKTLLPNGQHRDIIPFYVYGQYNSQSIAELYNGIPNCFEIVYHHSSGTSDNGISGNASVPSSPIEMPIAESVTKTGTDTSVKEVLKSVFSLNNTGYVFNDKTEKMDVAPYAKEGRTYVPVRYLAYALGVTPEGIIWNQENQTVTVTQNKIVVNMTIGSNIMTVNGTPTTMDVVPEIVDNRTMLPARYLAEALGAKITWNSENNSVEIEKPGN